MNTQQMHPETLTQEIASLEDQHEEIGSTVSLGKYNPPDPNSRSSLCRLAAEQEKAGQWDEVIGTWEKLVVLSAEKGTNTAYYEKHLARAKKIAADPVLRMTREQIAKTIEEHLAFSNPDYGIRTVSKTLYTLAKGKHEKDNMVNRLLFHAACCCAKWNDAMLARKADNKLIFAAAVQQPVCKVLQFLRTHCPPGEC